MVDHSKIEGLHRNIYNFMKKKAMSYESGQSPELLSCRREQIRISKRDFRKSTIDQLLKRIDQSNVIYLGDFHTFDQNGRNLWRILQYLLSTKISVTIGVEFVRHEYQEFIEHYFEGHITEREFLESIEYAESWRFPWSYYRALFELAKKHKLKVLALNGQGTLHERDKFASQQLSYELTNHADKKILVLFGEYHILPSRLPKLVRKNIGDSLEQTIIHQNLDEVYWRQKENKKSYEVVRFNREEFVLLTSAPWVKYESLIYWYENLLEDPDFDIHESFYGEKEMGISANIPENFLFICEEILNSLSIDFPKDNIDNFNLYDSKNLPHVERILKTYGSGPIQNFYRKLIARGKSFKIPGQNNYYYSNYSINRLSWLAGIHVFNVILSKNEFPSLDEVKILKRGGSQRYIYFIYQFLMAYLSSKIINPFRKCNHYLDYLYISNSKNVEQDERKIAKITLSILASPNDITEIVKKKSLFHTYLSARSVGHMMAEILYEEFIKTGEKNLSTILSPLYLSDFSEKSFVKIVRKIFPRKTYKKKKKRLF